MESAFLSRSSIGSADPLSDVLALLKPRGYMSGGLDAGGDWAFEFAEDRIVRCFALVSGHCWLTMAGAAAPVALAAGDFLILPHGRPFQLASDPAVPPVDILAAVTAPLRGRVLTWQGGGGCLALSALFTFTGDHAGLLLRALPPVVHIQREADRAAMRWYLERMMTIVREPQPGSILLGEHLAQMILIEGLRLHTAEHIPGGNGWLAALADPQMRAAITAMHERPGHRWTLAALAGRAGMSRSAFALRFKQMVGTPAMEYLTQWRMLLAGERLAHSNDSISAVALSLGYESESAFGFAFRKRMGCSPRRYCTARNASVAA